MWISATASQRWPSLRRNATIFFSLKSWQSAFVMADVCLLVYVLWKQEGILHSDISGGNVCSLLSREALERQRAECLDRSEQVRSGLGGTCAAEELASLVAQDFWLGGPLGCLIDLSNAAQGTDEFDSTIPGAEERQRQLEQTRSATYAFWSRSDWERLVASRSGWVPGTRHGPDDELEALLCVCSWRWRAIWQCSEEKAGAKSDGRPSPVKRSQTWPV